MDEFEIQETKESLSKMMSSEDFKNLVDFIKRRKSEVSSEVNFVKNKSNDLPLDLSRPSDIDTAMLDRERLISTLQILKDFDVDSEMSERIIELLVRVEEYIFDARYNTL